MKARDKITVEITSVGMNGEGVAKVDGMVVFVPYTLQGERAIVEITQVKKARERRQGPAAMQTVF